MREPGRAGLRVPRRRRAWSGRGRRASRREGRARLTTSQLGVALFAMSRRCARLDAARRVA
jgi:hypothetical protein